jgi:phosphate transport system substrate-binding protein
VRGRALSERRKVTMGIGTYRRIQPQLMRLCEKYGDVGHRSEIRMKRAPKFLQLTSFVLGGTMLFLSAHSGPLAAAELKVSGAAALAGAIMTPHKSAIEQETGLSLSLTVNGDANGLKDLYEGKTDVAMTAAPLKLTEEALNKAKPGSISIAGIENAPVGAVHIKFAVHASNPVKSLTGSQLKDIFTGKITSWKEVGGADAPIMVVAEPQGFGTRSNIVATLLGGSEIGDKARTVQALVQVAQVVAQAPNAIGNGNDATLKGNVAVIPGVEVKQVLGLATRGAPNADVKKLIAAVAKIGAAKN